MSNSLLRSVRQRVFLDDFRLPGGIFTRKYASYSVFEFDKFMYELTDNPFQFSLGAYGGSFCVEVVGGDREMIKSAYAFDPIRRCDFFSACYKEFLFSELKSGAHRIELLADQLLWFDLDERWGAYGSRDLGLVLLGAETNFTNDPRIPDRRLSRETTFGILNGALEDEVAAQEFLAEIEANYDLWAQGGERKAGDN